MKNYMDKIKTLRAQNGLSQEELAERSGLSLRTIQRIENGETEPRGDSLKRVAAALGVTPNDIMEWAMTENDPFLSTLNLSALTSLAFPLLGIIVPYILWNGKKDSVKGARHVGREVINFQITWAILHFLSVVAMTLVVLRGVTVGDMSETSMMKFVIGMIVISSSLLWFNLIMILVNQWRISKGKPVRYRPKINFIP